MAGATIALWVKRDGAPRFVKLRATAADVDDLTEVIVKKLKLEERRSTLTLHVAADTDTEGKDLGAALDSTDSIEEALPQAGKIRIVIKAAGAAAPLVPAGVHLLCAAQSSVGGCWLHCLLCVEQLGMLGNAHV